MRISVTHTTAYTYPGLVHLQPHVIRLRPRDDAAQRLCSYRLSITPPPAGQSAQTDPDGNHVVQAWFTEPAAALAIESAFQVDTLRENPFDYLLPPAETLALPLRLPGGLDAPLAPYLCAADPAVNAFSAGISAAAGGHLMPFLEGLNLALFEQSQHVLRPDGSPHTAVETLLTRQGSCRDLAVLFCAAARAVGVPARFVSGYEIAAAAEDPAYMHAWAEVYVPGGGWRGYDPSRGLAVGAAHVAVAAAADPAHAAPISGAYAGPGGSLMDFRIAMQAGGA